MSDNLRENLPEGAMVNCEIVVWQYMDGQTGEIKWMTYYDGDVPLSQVLGLLDLAKMDMVNRVAGQLFNDDEEEPASDD